MKFHHGRVMQLSLVFAINVDHSELSKQSGHSDHLFKLTSALWKHVGWTLRVCTLSPKVGVRIPPIKVSMSLTCFRRSLFPHSFNRGRQCDVKIPTRWQLCENYVHTNATESLLFSLINKNSSSWKTIWILFTFTWTYFLLSHYDYRVPTWLRSYWRIAWLLRYARNTVRNVRRMFTRRLLVPTRRRQRE